MADTYSKKQLQQKRAKKKQDKLERREERKSNNDKGKSLEEMTVYLDEDGNFTDVPPEKQKRSKGTSSDDIQLGAAPRNEVDEVKEGTVALFFSEKGYGFITDDASKENIFVHVEQVQQPIKEKDRVRYKIKRTPRGLTATEVVKL